MRDVITIFAAGVLMMGYALVAPTLVGAMQTPAPASQKTFSERLVQAGGDARVSVVSGNGMVHVSAGSQLPLFTRY